MKLRKVPWKHKLKRSNVNNVYTRDCFCGGESVSPGLWGRVCGHRGNVIPNNMKRKMVDLWKNRYRFARILGPVGRQWIRSSADEV